MFQARVTCTSSRCTAAPTPDCDTPHRMQACNGSEDWPAITFGRGICISPQEHEAVLAPLVGKKKTGAKQNDLKCAG